MHICERTSECLQVVNQKPLCAGLQRADSVAIKRGSPKAEYKNSHIRKKPQWREFLKCSAALCTYKRPSWATNTHSSNPPPTISTYNRQGQRDSEGERGREAGTEGEREVNFCPLVLYSSLSNIQSSFQQQTSAKCLAHRPKTFSLWLWPTWIGLLFNVSAFIFKPHFWPHDLCCLWVSSNILPSFLPSFLSSASLSFLASYILPWNIARLSLNKKSIKWPMDQDWSLNQGLYTPDINVSIEPPVHLRCSCQSDTVSEPQQTPGGGFQVL